jgi:DNA-binding helix-turn-helix protein
MDKTSFGNFLKNARESAEMTQKELAKKAGFSDRAISMWENGTREISLYNADRLLKSLGQLFVIGTK